MPPRNRIPHPAPRIAKPRARNKVTVGQVTVRWHKSADGRTFVDARKYGRKIATYRDHTAALHEARRIALEIHQGGAEVLALTPADRADFAKIQSLTAARNADPVAAITEWDDCRALAGPHSLRTLITAGLAAVTRPAHPVPNVVAEFLKSKGIAGEHDTGGFDQRWGRDFRKLLGEFSRSHPGDIAAMQAADVEAWLAARTRRDGAPLSGKRHNYILAMIVALFRFARKRLYLPDILSAPQLVERAKLGTLAIPVFTPREMQTILGHTPPDLLPWPVLVGFNGLRVEEVALGKHAAPRKDCLRWEDFDWHEREICIRAEVAKTKYPRRIPIRDNTWHWLAQWRDAGSTGPVIPAGDVRGRIDSHRKTLMERLRALAKKHEGISAKMLNWRNALRHSFGSYRFAVLRNHELVASEMGDSPAMIKKHYHNPRPKSQATAWFSILPGENTSQLILFPAAASRH